MVQYSLTAFKWKTVRYLCGDDDSGGATRRSVLTVLAIGLAFVMGHSLTSRQASVLGQNMVGSGFAAVPGARAART